MKPKIFIDSTSNRLVFAIIKNNENIIENIETNKNMTEIFVSKLENFLKINKISKKDIHELYIVNGPGNFTGTRIGCVFANTLRIINNVNLFSISSCKFQKTKEDEISIIDAKSNLFYVIKDKKIVMLPYSEIEKIANEKGMSIINKYLEYDFNNCWAFNKNKFDSVEEVIPNYIKSVI